MKRLLVILLFCYSTTVFAQNQEKGKEFIHTLLIDKDYEKAHNYFDNNAKEKLPVSLLENTVGQLINQVGTFQKIIEVNSQGELYHFYSEFSKTSLDINISFDESGQINGLFFQPHKEFTTSTRLGEDLDIQSKDIKLKGTFLQADSNDNKKLVIFVHGSGPSDRDATVYENKPFMQIAEELYKYGISSYRFDKRTLTAPNSLNENLTVDEEVTDDVITIIDYFSSNPEFKDHEITAIGLSLGAYLMPRIANKSGNVDKVVMLAGNARPLEVLLIEQLEYINTLEKNEGNKQFLADSKEKVAFLKSKNFNQESTKESLPLNLPFSYWNSLNEYKHLAEAKKLKIPVLIAQGERDYQVTMEDYDIWKNTLKKNKNVTFKSYPHANHLFITGTGKSTPQEYRTKGEVDENLIKDIVAFVKEDK